MVKIMEEYKPSYKIEELNFRRFRQAFANKSHDVFVVYDEIMDQIIVRLVDPTILASEYFVAEDFAFLVRESNSEVVGYTIVNFESEYLPKIPELNMLWKSNNLAGAFEDYRKFKYEPEMRKIKEQTQRQEQRIVAYSAFKGKQAAILATA